MSAVAGKRAVSGLVDNESRGKALRARRLRHGIKSLRQLAMQSGVSRGVVTAAEEGTATDEAYDRLEAWFDRFEEETGSDRPADTSSPHMVTIRGTRAGDVDVVVSGPIDDIDKLAETVERLLLATERKKAAEEAPDSPE